MARANSAKRFWLNGRSSFDLWCVEQDGRDAFKAGVPMRENPHWYALEREHWERGWSAARRAA